MGKQKIGVRWTRGMLLTLLLGSWALAAVVANAAGRPMTLILLAYQGEGAAQKTLEAFKTSDPSDYEFIDALAVVIKHPDGSTTVIQHHKRSRMAGDVVESVVAVVKTPQGTAGGGATLETPVAIKHHQAPQEALDKIKTDLTPDSSVIIAMTPQDKATQVLNNLKQNATQNDEYQIQPGEE